MSISKKATVGAIATASAAAALFFINTESTPAKRETSTQASTAALPDYHINPGMAQAMERDLGIPAKQVPHYFKVQQQANVTEAMAKQHFGRQYAGTWLETNDKGESRIVVATTSPTSSDRFGDAEVRHVRHTEQELHGAVANLNNIVQHAAERRPLKGVQSWSVDIQNNLVEISVLEGHDDEAINLAALSGLSADGFRIRRAAGVAATSARDIDGGLRYDTSNGFTCSVGFSVTLTAKSSTKGFITAGHCPSGGGTTTGAELYEPGGRYRNVSPFDTREKVGNFAAVDYPTTDMAWVKVDQNLGTLYGDIYTYGKVSGDWLNVTGSKEAVNGAAICRYGYVTGWKCGKITSTNASATYGGTDVVNNLREATACTTQGDSGGPWLAGSEAQGVTSGAEMTSTQTFDDVKRKTNCSGRPAGTDAKTWYQPVNPILKKYGLTLKTE